MFAEDYFNGQATAAQLLGMNPGRGTRAAGEVLPLTTSGPGDHAMSWWDPDSPTFWGIVIIALTAAGMAGADARVRLFRRRASVSVGES